MIKRKLMTALLLAAVVVSGTVSTTPVSAASKVKVGKKYRVKVHKKKKKVKAIKVKYNGNKLSTYAPAFSYKGTKLIPPKHTLKKMGVSYTLNGSKITLKKNNVTIKLTVNKKTAYVNGKKYTMPTSAARVYSYKNKITYTYVPAKFCASQLGINYKYSGNTLSFSGISTTQAQKKENSNQYASNSVILNKPSGVNDSDVSIYDNYKEYRAIIYIKGNYVYYYKNSANYTIYKDSKFYSYKVGYENGRTKIYIRPRKATIKGFRVTQTDSKIIVHYDTPRKLYSRIIVLDAGHGGHDTGAASNGYREKTMTLKIVKAAKKYFDQDSRYKVYYTRLSDTYPSLRGRSTLANKVGADRFISIHINSAGRSAKGTETLYNSRGHKSSTGLTSYRWSKTVHPYIRSATGFVNRGLVNRTGLSVLRHTNTASTLTEIGFISNKKEAKKMNKNLTKYGKAAYNSIVSSFSKHPTGR